MVFLGALLVGLGLGAVALGLARTRAVAVSAPALDVAYPVDEADETPARAGLVYRALEPVLEAAGTLLKRLSPIGRVALLRQRIAQAGLEGALSVERVLSYKAASGVAGAALGYLARPGALSPLIWAVVGAVLGSFAPDVWLDSRAKQRQGEIARDLPEALDLLAITVEAGLGLEQALTIVTENLPGPLGVEFTRMLREIELGVRRREALTNLRARTSVSELSSFVVALIQADQVGAPIADVLRAQAAQVRLKRRQRAREKAAQTPVKILFPLIFFIFPALFVVVVGPGAIKIAEAIAGGG